MNCKKAFISERPDNLDSSNFLKILKGDYRYIIELKSKDVKMNNRKIIHCNESTTDNNVCSIKTLQSFTRKD